MRNFLPIALLAFSIPGFTQKPPVKFGDIPLEDMKMTVYAPDSSASALVLADYGESTILYDQGKSRFYINFERTRRLKILKKGGYDLATMTVQLYRVADVDEKLTGIKAVTYNLEGTKIVGTKMKSDGIFREKADNNLTNVKFTLPNVKEGSILEIAYKINSEFIFHFQDWAFQESIPVKWSEYRANIPEYFNYNSYMQGYIPLSVNEHKQTSHKIVLTTRVAGDKKSGAGAGVETDEIPYEESNARWVATNVPAFKVEPFMNNYHSYISKINFELAYTRYPNQPVKQYMGTWESLNSQFLEYNDFGGVIKGSGFLNGKVEELTSGMSDPKDKAGAIYSYVKSEIAWNGNYGTRSLGGLKKVIDEKKGNSADINLMLVAMLQKAGLVADPVLISTRNNGFVRQGSPVSTQFNYVICAVKLGDRQYLLDATDRSLPMSLLPQRCINGMGFVVSEKNSGWIDVVATVKSRTVISGDLVFSDEGKLTGKMNFTRDGYSAQEMRKAYFSKGEESYVKSVADGHAWEIHKSQFENVDKLSSPAKESHDLTIGEHVQGGGGTFYFNPMFDKRINENPLKQETREYPVDFGSPVEEIFTCKITVPDQFIVDELPKSKALALPSNAARFMYSAALIGNTINFTCSLSINKSLFVPDEYANLREFYNQVVAKEAEQIVLKKK